MNKLFLLAATALVVPSVLADGWDMMGGYGGGMMGAGAWMMGSFVGLIYFVILSFIFSAVFWWTYKWLIKEKKAK